MPVTQVWCDLPLPAMYTDQHGCDLPLPPIYIDQHAVDQGSCGRHLGTAGAFGAASASAWPQPTGCTPSAAWQDSGWQICLFACLPDVFLMAGGRSAEACCFGAGLTKVPIDGQPKSIVRDLEEMARTYIKVGCVHRNSGSAASLQVQAALAQEMPNLAGREALLLGPCWYLGSCSQSGLVPSFLLAWSLHLGSVVSHSNAGIVAGHNLALAETYKFEMVLCTCRVTTPSSWL